MKFHVLTLFPEAVKGGLCHSIMGRALLDGKITLNCVDIRNYAGNKHGRVDDYPFGGGAGLVMQPQPVYDAYKSLNVSENTRVVFLTPAGVPFNQSVARSLSMEDELVLLCGHYEGIDQRVIDEIVTDEISIGDYVLTGGEIAAMAVIDAVSRLLPGVLGKEESFMFESFTENLLEYPQYTRPREFMGRNVPEVLLNGNHGEIERWRKEKSEEITILKRPDLLKRPKG